MKKEQLIGLYKKLESKSRKGRGGDYNYIPWQDVADRMNQIFGGNWSSEVKSEITLGKDIIIRVRISIFDEITGKEYFQEGYGGASAITGAEAGNLHKSAYSKALRDACKKWGPGLYVDEDDSGSSDQKKAVKLQVTPPTQALNNQKVAVTKSKIPNIVKKTPEEKGVVVVPSASIPPVQATTTPKQGSVVEQTVPTASILDQQKSIIPPKTEVKTSLPPISNGSNSSIVSNTSVQNIENTKINDVQTAALDGILELKGIIEDELIKGAFEEYNIEHETLPTKDELLYKQAVLVIKYGNEKFRNR